MRRMPHDRGGWSGDCRIGSDDFGGAAYCAPEDGAEKPERELYGVGRKTESGAASGGAMQPPIQVK